MKAYQYLQTLFLIIGTTNLVAQTTLTIRHSCQWNIDKSKDKITIFDPSNEAQQIIGRITSTMGLAPNFIIKAAAINNALATIEGGQRYILYSTAFLENFKHDAQTRWAAYCVIAHEIGHHLNNHDFIIEDPTRRKVMELQADHFAGHILQKMGASLEEAQAGIQTFTLSQETALHPAKKARLEAVMQGWEKAQADAKTKWALTEADNKIAATKWYDKGKIAYLASQYEQAIEYFTIAIRLKQDYGEAYHYRGLAKYYLAEYAEAITDYNHALKIDPYYGLYNSRGKAKYHLRRYAEAIADYDQAIGLNPSYASSYANRANAKIQLGKLAEALDDCDIAISLDSVAHWAYANRANVKRELGKYAESIADHDHAIRLEPNNSGYYNNRGLSKYDLGKKVEAIADYDESIRLDSLDSTPYNHRGNAKQDLGKDSEAIADFDYVLRFYPNSATTYTKRGKSKSKLGKFLEAIEDYDVAIRLDPKLALPYALKSCALVALGKYNEALAIIKQAENIDNSFKITDWMQKCKQEALSKLKD